MPYDPRVPRKFLSIGSGEILPYIIRQWEPSSTRLDCVDLSQTSIFRARFRTALLGRKITFHCDDINRLLSTGALRGQKFDHIEAYGVLHHISSFGQTLKLMSNHLTADGLARIMVYNSPARDWIWQINRAFRSLRLRFESDSDISRARKLLTDLSRLSPRLDYRLSQVGWQSLQNNTRFADTFLHPWESRATIEDWYEAFETAGLEAFALFDRYAELDDLSNPLWRCPTSKELSDRSRDLRFENNLEVWLRPVTAKIKPDSIMSPHPAASQIPVRLRLTMPAMNFSKYTETKDLSFGAKLTLWQGFLRGLHNVADQSVVRLIRELDPKAASRLARIGLILPEAARLAGRYEELMAPRVKQMAPLVLPEASNELITPQLQKLCAEMCSDQALARLAFHRLQRIL
jgi:SAM-dependent methyltransferase